LEFTYDAQSRRVAKRTLRREAGQWEPVAHRLFVYDGWNLLTEVDALSDLKPVRLCTWGLDLSGTLQGAGGVGGLLFTREVTGAFGDQAVCFDGNGNVSALCDLATAQVTATYDYGPFGDLLTADGPAAHANPFRFSTKYTDPETGLLYYGYRFYNPSTGRWLNRDPLGEAGGEDLYRYCGNDPIRIFDVLGLYQADGHFYATYIVAKLNGYNDRDAYELAYYSQYPDQHRSLDAVMAGFEIAQQFLVRAIAAENGVYAKDQSAEQWETQRYIHSLLGGGIEEVERYRKCLERMISQGGLALWEQGILMHALGDTYAHLEGSAPNQKAYAPPFGHALDMHGPDIPSGGRERFSAYMRRLNNVLGGTGDPKHIDVVTRRLTMVFSDGNDRIESARQLAQHYGYREPYNPATPWALDPRMPAIGKGQINELVDKLKTECCR